MALNEIVAHHSGVAPGQFRRDLEPIFQRIEGVLIDILGLDLKPIIFLVQPENQRRVNLRVGMISNALSHVNTGKRMPQTLGEL